MTICNVAFFYTYIYILYRYVGEERSLTLVKIFSVFSFPAAQSVGSAFGRSGALRHGCTETHSIYKHTAFLHKQYLISNKVNFFFLYLFVFFFLIIAEKK